MRAVNHIRNLLTGHRIYSVDALTGFERWAPDYAAEDNPILSLANQSTGRLLPELAGLRVLDFGCGVGKMARFIKAGGADTVIAMDFSWGMLAAAQTQQQQASMQLVQANGLELPFLNHSFDLVLSSFVMGYIENLGKAVAEMARVIRPGGTILLSDLHPAGRKAGWNRSFLQRHDSGFDEFCIQSHDHRPDDYLNAFAATGLHCNLKLEPAIDETVAHFFAGTRRGRRLFNKYRQHPAVLIFKLKPSHHAIT